MRKMRRVGERVYHGHRCKYMYGVYLVMTERVGFWLLAFVIDGMG
jgi:hypothetical protein